MEIDKKDLQTMFREVFAINNPVCLAYCRIFLKRIGLNEQEIEEWLRKDEWTEDEWKYGKDEEDDYLQAIQDTKDYFDY